MAGSSLGHAGIWPAGASPLGVPLGLKLVYRLLVAVARWTVLVPQWRADRPMTTSSHKAKSRPAGEGAHRD